MQGQIKERKTERQDRMHKHKNGRRQKIAGNK
jgi:hypothetical protein